MPNLSIFGLGVSAEYAGKIANKIGVPLNLVHEEWRPDDEAYTTSLDNVRGHDVYIISSIYSDQLRTVNDKIMRVLIFINALRHASAARITLVAPYLCYMRQDRKTESRAPIATQAIAIMLEGVGMDRLITMDVHNLGAEQNAFRVPIDNLEGRKLLADAVAGVILNERPSGIILTDQATPWCVLAPDVGGVGRAKLFQASLYKRLSQHVEIAYADKTRYSINHVSVEIIGHVKHRRVITVDDIIGTGKTMEENRDAVEKAGGQFWGVVATHGLFVDDAGHHLRNCNRIFVTDTIVPWRLYDHSTYSLIRLVSTVGMFAEAIKRTHEEGGSISQLLED